jgi:hypothetical protein
LIRDFVLQSLFIMGDKTMGSNTANFGGWGVSRWKVTAWGGVAALILLVPLIAMQFTEEVKWTAFDFVLMGALIFGTGLAYELIAGKGGTIAYRVAVGLACATGFILVWINAAVGIIGDGPVNLLYFGVLAVGFFGALLARFQPHGMSLTLFATAVAQMLIPVIALVIWKAGWQDLLTDSDSPHLPFAPGVLQVFALNAVFAASWFGSALLFRESARGGAEQVAA